MAKLSSNTGDTPHKAGTFKKGDPRINRNGQIGKKRLAFNKALRELLVEEGEREHTIKVEGIPIKKRKVEWLVMSVWQKAVAGESWAVNFIAERVEGRIVQPINEEGDFEPLKVIISKNGNESD